MANNEYVNKVQFGDTTIMDISDTTAESNDVIEGEVFYTKSGARSTGTLGDATQSTHGLMSATDKTKLDNIDEMIGATSSADGTGGLVPTPTTTDVDKFLSGDGTWKNGGKPMVILSYGNSTWQDFINAYKDNIIVYCRASANSNPASGSQTRLGFMAYVNDASTPTNVEFQYYRSMSSHSDTAMGDEVYVYKLTNSNGGTWSVTTRKASIKEIAVASGSKLGVSWSSDKVTLSNTMTADDMPMSTSDNTTVKAAIEAKYTKPSGGIPSIDLAETYLTSHQDISGKANSADLATVATSGSYNDLINTPTTATTSSAGLMSATDKTKLDNINLSNEIHYIEGPSTDTAGTWTGTLTGLTAYYDGLTIIYVPYIAGASGTTLNLNNLGDIPCYYNSTALATEYPAGTPILLTYINNTWKRADYDSNTTAISNLINNSGPYVADSDVYRYQLLFQIDENTLTPLNNVSNSTGTSKTMLTDVEFNAFGHIFYYTSTTTISASANIGAGSTAWAWSGINLRYTFNCGTTLTANKPFYLVVTPTSNGKCKIASTTPWAHTLPSTNDGKWYILLGRTYSNYQMHLSPFHPVYMHNGTKVVELVSDGIDCSQFVTKTDAEFENSVSMGRKTNTIIGSGSVAMGVDVEASANSCYAEGGYTTASAQGAHAEGSHTTASGEASHAEGYYTIASGDLSHAEGDLTVASGVASHAEGIGTTAAGALSHAGGIYNIEDSYNAWPEWTANTSYAVGDKVKITDNETIVGYVCKTANTDATFTSSNWTNRQGQMNYAEIIGNGTADNARSNARTLDWDGNEYLKGDLYVNCNSDSSGGTKILTAINNKADDNLVVHLSGSESITGTKAMTGTFVINNDASTPLFHFRGTNNSSVSGYISLSGAGSGTANTYGNARFDFVEYSPTSTGSRSSYAETYRLPSANTDINASVTYNILTSKTAVTIAQGGTGGTTKAEAQTNLGISALGTVTRSSNTSTLKKWYTSLPGGLKIAVVEKQVSITTGASGSVYWKNVPAETWPVTFTAAPIVFTDTRSSDTNGWSWGYTSAPTTTSTGTIAVARGTDVDDQKIFVKWLGIGY